MLWKHIPAKQGTAGSTPSASTACLLFSVAALHLCWPLQHAGESLPYPEPEDDRVPTDQYRWLSIEQVKPLPVTDSAITCMPNGASWHE